ncbi:hypothetical protein EHQ27_06880 [Leptospira wolffii]|uniref:Band 7 domain-containing protein n=1 Tax=Leptospira wolffii TaxID=409998 RepID=A0A2M9ZBB8_9LEPT|nr:hypothetical protein [Leptospira wolffii]PJZ65709.1 hypothetical protein CH371_12355 [Leptospira wolffii]TGK56074.1 hypothetical protein EHQ32_16815 [Leptospira wolffii]TGK72120.1 hypothetical protein EHQ35_12250 [Leptospira wolffii]TGK73785.1 hypothetical protein EHQ27_06880 [Leptospira wolffii]TGL27697.1 hypothetical protein EHQ57_15075 [Leptospira wolffii]
MFRKVGRALFILFILAGVAVLSYPVFLISEGEALVVWEKDGRLISFIRGPGFVYEFGVLQFWEKSVGKEPLHSLSSVLELEYDLSAGLFPEGSNEGKIKSRLDVSYRLEGEEARKWFSSGGRSEAGRTKYLSGVLVSRLRAAIEDEKTLNLTRDSISGFLRKDLGPEIGKELGWLKVESIRILSLDVPEPIVIANLFRNPNFILAKKSEKIEALKKAELYLIQEEAKLSASRKKWEQYKDFLKKNPDMKDFLLYDNIGDNVDVILLPSDSVFGDPKSLAKKKQSAPKPKEVE